MIDWVTADAVLFRESQACLADYVSAGLHEDVYAFAIYVDGKNFSFLPCCDTNAHARKFQASIGESGDFSRWSHLGDWSAAGGMFVSPERKEQFSQAWLPIEAQLKGAAPQKGAAAKDVACSRALIECALRTVLRLLFTGDLDPYKGLSGISAKSEQDPMLRADIHTRRQKLDPFRHRSSVPKAGKRSSTLERLGGRKWESGHWNLIDLAGTQLEDDDIRLIRDSQTVTALCLNGTPLTDAAAEMMGKGKWRGNLRELWIRGTNISPEAVAQLREQWPELQVWS